jgi:hypothetical protein
MTVSPKLDLYQIEVLLTLVAARIHTLRTMGKATDPAIERDTDRYIRDLHHIRNTLDAMKQS